MNTKANLAAVHHDASHYAITNSKMIETPERDCYIVGTLRSAHELVIEPTTSIVAKDKLAQDTYAQVGAHTNTRTDVQTGKVKIGQNRLIALGGIMCLVDEDDTTGIPLHVRNGKFPMSGKVTQQSGLCSGHPLKSVWLRINEEFGGVYVHHNTKTIEVVIIKPDEHTQYVHPTLVDQIVHAKKACEANIRREVGQLYPSTLKMKTVDGGKVEPTWKIEWTEVTPAPAVIPGINDTMSFAGLTTGEISGIVFDEPARATTNVNLLLTVPMPHSLETLKLIDMEGYGRQGKLYSPQQIVELGNAATPALMNFGERMAEAMGLKAAPVITASPAARII